MNIEQTVDRIIDEFQRDRESATRYIWWTTFDRALIEIEPSRRARSSAFAETVLYGRRRQLEEFSNEPDAKIEMEALQIAIQRLRRG
jgi:hypothetical protein